MNPFIPSVVQELLSKPVAYYQDHPSEPAEGKAPLTNVAFILDCSGSMTSGKEATIEGFNAQVETVRQGAEGAGRTTYTDVHFSSEVNIRMLGGDLAELGPLTDETYLTQGNTALLDALGSTVAALLQTADIHSSNTAMLVTVFTDGKENASRVYTGIIIKGMVDRLEATGRWTFALVGPHSSVSGLAEMLSFKKENTSGYDERFASEKLRAMNKMSSANFNFMSSRSQGMTKAVKLFDDDLPLT